MALPTDFVDGDVLSAADVNGITTAVNAKPDDLADLGDVDLSGLADGDFLQYDNASGDWLPAQIPPPASPIGLILALGG
jgi:hypothetical protein